MIRRIAASKASATETTSTSTRINTENASASDVDSVCEVEEDDSNSNTNSNEPASKRQRRSYPQDSPSEEDEEGSEDDDNSQSDSSSSEDEEYHDCADNDEDSGNTTRGRRGRRRSVSTASSTTSFSSLSQRYSKHQQQRHALSQICRHVLVKKIFAFLIDEDDFVNWRFKIYNRGNKPTPALVALNAHPHYHYAAGIPVPPPHPAYPIYVNNMGSDNHNHNHIASATSPGGLPSSAPFPSATIGSHIHFMSEKEFNLSRRSAADASHQQHQYHHDPNSDVVWNTSTRANLVLVCREWYSLILKQRRRMTFTVENIKADDVLNSREIDIAVFIIDTCTNTTTNNSSSNYSSPTSPTKIQSCFAPVMALMEDFVRQLTKPLEESIGPNRTRPRSNGIVTNINNSSGYDKSTFESIREITLCGWDDLYLRFITNNDDNPSNNSTAVLDETEADLTQLFKRCTALQSFKLFSNKSVNWDWVSRNICVPDLSNITIFKCPNISNMDINTFIKPSADGDDAVNTNLERLFLFGTIDNQWANNFIHRLSKLTSLTLSVSDRYRHFSFAPRGIRSDSLTELSFENASVTDDYVNEYLCGASPAPSKSSTAPTYPGATKQSVPFPKLQSLSFWACMQLVSPTFNLPNLTSLTCMECVIDDACIENSLPYLKNLRKLNLSFCSNLVRPCILYPPSLTEVDMKYCYELAFPQFICSAGPEASSLQILDLSYCLSLSDSFVMDLRKGGLHTLTKLILSGAHPPNLIVSSNHRSRHVNTGVGTDSSGTNNNNNYGDARLAAMAIAQHITMMNNGTPYDYNNNNNNSSNSAAMWGPPAIMQPTTPQSHQPTTSPTIMLQELILSDTEIDDEWLEDLGLPNLPHLRYLDLSSCGSLVNPVIENASLRRLNFYRCRKLRYPTIRCPSVIDINLLRCPSLAITPDNVPAIIGMPIITATTTANSDMDAIDSTVVSFAEHIQNSRPATVLRNALMQQMQHYHPMHQQQQQQQLNDSTGSAGYSYNNNGFRNSWLRTCSFCGKEKPNLKRCSLCKTTYCSVSCQSQDWYIHRKYCYTI